VKYSNKNINKFWLKYKQSCWLNKTLFIRGYTLEWLVISKNFRLLVIKERPTNFLVIWVTFRSYRNHPLYAIIKKHSDGLKHVWGCWRYIYLKKYFLSSNSTHEWIMIIKGYRVFGWARWKYKFIWGILLVVIDLNPFIIFKI